MVHMHGSVAATRYCMTVEDIDGNFLTLGQNDSDDGNVTRFELIQTLILSLILITMQTYQRLYTKVDRKLRFSSCYCCYKNTLVLT